MISGGNSFGKRSAHANQIRREDRYLNLRIITTIDGDTPFIAHKTNRVANLLQTGYIDFLCENAGTKNQLKKQDGK
jgi:hypothetical protein